MLRNPSGLSLIFSQAEDSTTTQLSEYESDTYFEIETNILRLIVSVSLSVENFKCCHYSYIMFLKHLESKDFKSHFLLIHFSWIREKKHVGILKVKVLQITFFFNSRHLKAVFFQVSQMIFHTLLLHQLLKLTKLHI